MIAPRLIAALCCLFALAATSTQAADKPVHVFIMSGQSNMVGLDPDDGFRQVLEEALPDADIVIIKHARSGQSVTKWHMPERELKNGKKMEAKRGPTYRALIEKVKADMPANAASVTLIWMQGEADSRGGNHEHYEGWFNAFLGYLMEDTGRDDIGVVLGRISDYGPQEKHPEWNQIRELQVKMADSHDNWRWIDTDDLNGEHNGLHYPKDGYREMGRRFATAALDIIKK